MNGTQRCISLRKGPHRYVFTYPVGFEAEVIAQILEYAADPDHELDWIDAAMLSFQMGRDTRPTAIGAVR